MKHIILLSAFLLITIGCQNKNSSKETFQESEKDSLKLISNNYLSALADLEKFNGVVLLKKDGKEILKRAYNIHNDSISTLYVKDNSQFDLRSIAKLFAKISIIKLEQENKIKRTNFVEKYIPKFPNGNKITIEHLANNKSGLPREFSNDKTLYLSPEEVIELASKEKLEFIPGTKEQYSNVGFQLLYYIIGKQSKSTYSDYLKKTFFKPLGMKSSGGNFDKDLNHLKNYAYGHFLNDSNEIVCDCTFLEDESRMGNLHSTVEDLNLFLQSLDTVTYKSVVKGGKIAHAGGTRGKRAYIERNFKENYTIIFLANYDDIPFQNLVKNLQHILKGEKITMPKKIERKAINVKSSILKKYVGTYDFIEAGHLIIDIKLENDSLYVYQKGNNNGVLYPEKENIFFGDKNSEESFEFKRDEFGEYYILMDFKGVQWKGMKIKNKND